MLILEQNSEIAFSFLDKYIWSGCHKFFLLRWKYLSSGVNVLRNSPLFTDITKRGFFQLHFSETDKK